VLLSYEHGPKQGNTLKAKLVQSTRSFFCKEQLASSTNQSKLHGGGIEYVYFDLEMIIFIGENPPSRSAAADDMHCDDYHAGHRFSRSSLSFLFVHSPL
jgi:hypothetical protein